MKDITIKITGRRFVGDEAEDEMEFADTLHITDTLHTANTLRIKFLQVHHCNNCQSSVIKKLNALDG